MKEKTWVTIVGYILIGILLLPILAIGLILIVGISLFLILYIRDRVKNGRDDPKKGRPYKLASALLLIICILVYSFSPAFTTWPLLSWQTWWLWQAIVFVGLIPLDIYQILKLKHKI